MIISHITIYRNPFQPPERVDECMVAAFFAGSIMLHFFWFRVCANVPNNDPDNHILMTVNPES
jgi:hypothetical protein